MRIGAAENENSASTARLNILNVVYFGSARAPAGRLERHVGPIESDPRHHAAQEAMPLRHRAYRLVRSRRKQAEVGRPGDDGRLAEPIDQPIESLRGGPLEPGGAFGLLSNRRHHVMAPPPERDHLRNQSGGMLQVGVHHHHRRSDCHVEAGRERNLMPAVSGQRKHPQALVRVREAVQTLERRVGTAVVDEADAPREVEPFENARQLRIETLDDLGLVIAGHDNRQVGAVSLCNRSTVSALLSGY